MDTSFLLWELVGLTLSLVLGRQLLAIAYKERRLALDSGLDWPYETARTPVLGLYGIAFAGAGIIVFFLFGWEVLLIGLIAGVPLGYLLRGVWKIDDKLPDDEPNATYAGD